MEIRVTLKEYLAHLEAEESKKPIYDRRRVPTLGLLADGLGVSRQHLYNIANNQYGQFKLDVLSDLIRELRRWGFNAELSDVLTLEEGDGKGELGPADLALAGAFTV